MQKRIFWFCICVLFVYCNEPEDHSLKNLCPDTTSGMSYYAFNCNEIILNEGDEDRIKSDQKIKAAFYNKPEIVEGLSCRKFVFDVDQPELFIHFCCTDKNVLVWHQAGERVALDTIMHWDGETSKWCIKSSPPPKAYERFIIEPASYDYYLQDSVYSFRGTLGLINELKTWSGYYIVFAPKYGVIYFEYSLEYKYTLRCKCNSPKMKKFWAWQDL